MYIEDIIIDNLIINFAILFVCKKVLKLNARNAFLVLGSVIGTISVIVFSIFQIDGIKLLLFKFFISILMVLLSFNYKNFKCFLLNYFCFLFSTALMGGMCFFISFSFGKSVVTDGVVSYELGLPMGIVILMIMIVSYVVIHFVKSVKEFADANTGAEITDYLQSITLMCDIDTLDETQNYISVMTVHASKGLEFPVVFIVGLNEGVFPLSRAIKSNNPSELEEERRLMYVAVTRAEKRLYLTRSRTRFSFETHSLEYTTESRFLKEMGGFQESSSGALVRSRYTLNESSTQLQTEALASKLSSAISASKPQATAQQPKKNYALYKTGVMVTHPTFGKGEITLGVTDFVSLFVTVKFETVGVKTLSLKFAPLEIIENEG